MAQAVELNLAYIAAQVQASSAAPKKLFFGKDFAHVGVGGRVPYQQLIETIQTCIHKAQDKGEKNYKGLAEKTIRQLKDIARIQKIASPQNIDLITKVAIEALKPNEIFQAWAKMKSNPIIEKGVFQKALSLLIFAKETQIIDEEQTRSKKNAVSAQQALQTTIPGKAVAQTAKTITFHHRFPKSISSTGLAFYFRWVKNTLTIEGLTAPHINLSVEDLDELKTFLDDDDIEVRGIAQSFITFVESNLYLALRNDKIMQNFTAYDDIKKASDIESSENQAFMEQHNPIIGQLNGLLMENMLAPMSDELFYSRRIEIFDQTPKYEDINRFVYRYFYNELARLLKPGEKLTSKYPSILREHDYILPTPEKFESFFTDKEVERPQPEEKQPLATPKTSKKKPHSKEGASAAAPASAMAPTSAAAPSPAFAAQAAAAPAPKPHAPKPQDELLAILAKKEFPVKEIVYSDRVLKTFETADKASHAVDGEWRHTFPEELDQFLGTGYSQKREWINQTTGHRDTLYVMPGEVEVSKGEWKRCQFEWCIGADGKCYHRFCSYKEKNTLIESWMTGTAFTDENFPSLQQSFKDATWKAKPQAKKDEKIKIELHPVWNYITFTDAMNISCRVFKVGR